ncbi:uncharacterized protein LOC141629333 [Silene latifolia]|uniref:uncharacterized protein LOC141629333 n=1 Tax=Silene latifolia TaxID=37657 RepID=UPI003D77505C
METVMHPSNFKSRVQLENEAFNKVMYGKDTPTRPVGYGYGVKQSDVFGLHSILRKEGFGCGASSSLALKKMKKAVADVTKENKELKTKCDESNGVLKKTTTQFAQILDLFSTGKATTEIIDMAKSVLNMNMGSTQVSDSSDGDDAASYVD